MKIIDFIKATDVFNEFPLSNLPLFHQKIETLENKMEEEMSELKPVDAYELHAALSSDILNYINGPLYRSQPEKVKWAIHDITDNFKEQLTSLKDFDLKEYLRQTLQKRIIAESKEPKESKEESPFKTVETARAFIFQTLNEYYKNRQTGFWGLFTSSCINEQDRLILETLSNINKVTSFKEIRLMLNNLDQKIHAIEYRVKPIASYPENDFKKGNELYEKYALKRARFKDDYILTHYQNERLERAIKKIFEAANRNYILGLQIEKAEKAPIKTKILLGIYCAQPKECALPTLKNSSIFDRNNLRQIFDFADLSNPLMDSLHDGIRETEAKESVIKPSASIM